MRTLLARYASARIALAEKNTLAWQRELDEVTRALCALTGARSVADAIATADDILDRHARKRRASRLSTAGEGAALAA